MVTAAKALRKYGSPVDDKATTVNENTRFEGTHMILWDVPEDINRAIPAIPNRIYCNRDMVAPLERGFRNVIARGITDQIKTWDGCFNIRNKRGLSSMSLHSWGIAIDINAAWNGLGRKPTMSAALVKCFTDAGFDWGGTWKRADGMHFELASI